MPKLAPAVPPVADPSKVLTEVITPIGEDHPPAGLPVDPPPVEIEPAPVVEPPVTKPETDTAKAKAKADKAAAKEKAKADKAKIASAADIPSADEIEAAGEEPECERTEDGAHVPEVRDGAIRCVKCEKVLSDDPIAARASAEAAGKAAQAELEAQRTVPNTPPDHTTHAKRAWLVDCDVSWTPRGMSQSTFIPKGTTLNLTNDEVKDLIESTPSLVDHVRPRFLEDEERRTVVAEANAMMQAGHPVPPALAKLVAMALGVGE